MSDGFGYNKSNKELATDIFDMASDETLSRLDEKEQSDGPPAKQAVAFSPLDENQVTVLEANDDFTEFSVDRPDRRTDQGTKSAAKLRSEMKIGATDPLPATEEIAGGVRAKIEHERLRSRRSRNTDERMDAELTTDYEKWSNNKDRYDYPGVDTDSADEGFQF